MEKLIKGTTAFAILSGDKRCGRLSHAYMLHFQDEANLRAALKIFAAEFFGAADGSPLYNRVMSESLTDLTVYPQDGGKISADGVSDIISDSAMRPVEGAVKLYIICGFENASAIVQNKLLKTLEEPLEGVHFLLGVTSVAPVLDTVRSRVKLLEIPPFTEEEIFSALERQGVNELNAAAAKSSGGILGAAQNILRGNWFDGILAAAKEICFTAKTGDVGVVAAKYGDTKYKRELLTEMQRLYFTALTEKDELSSVWSESTLVYALESVDGAFADVKFNAFFQGLLYDFMLRIIERERRSKGVR